MKRPTDNKLVSQALEAMSGEELKQLFVDIFTEDELRKIALENMSEETLHDMADDEWDGVCFEEDCRRERQLWESGAYS